jgi:hypothetical protein
MGGSFRKRVLEAGRVRRPPRAGFSWVDRRFLREHAEALSRDAILLYLFLAAVGDQEGLSYWSDHTVAARLKLERGAVVAARGELLRRDLIACAPPLTQVLSVPEPIDRRPSTGPRTLADLLRRADRGHDDRR